jgi:hypothetical protein
MTAKSITRRTIPPVDRLIRQTDDLLQERTGLIRQRDDLLQERTRLLRSRDDLISEIESSKRFAIGRFRFETIVRSSPTLRPIS